MPSLIYIADPMCSWCYGFGPELTALLEGLPGLPVHVMVGGLRAYNAQPLDAAAHADVLSHWKEVAQRTGLPFNEAGVAQDFVYNTEPACRAVVAARILAPKTALGVLTAIQHAFYVEGLDVTDGKVLASVASAALNAAGVPTSEDEFIATWKSETAIMQTYADFEQRKKWGVDGFPALVLERDGVLDLVTLGYVPMPRLIEQMQEIVDRNSNVDTAAALPA